MATNNEILKRIRMLTAYSNLDENYGVWDSIADANANIPIGVRKPGLTLGIYSDINTVEEYWYNEGISDSDLVLKADLITTESVTDSGALMDSEITNLQEVKSFDSSDYEPTKGTDDNYVTDAEKVVIGNTSETNTGDEDTISIQTKRPLKNIESLSLEGNGNIDLTKVMVGLGSADNTSDLNKPISNNTQTALNSKLGINETAADSEKLDGLNSTNFLKTSDALTEVTDTNKLITVEDYGGLIYISQWNPTTNTPTLADADATKFREAYISLNDFTRFGIDWEKGDYLVYDINGDIFKEKNPLLNIVSTVGFSNNYDDLDNFPTFKTVENLSILGSGNIDLTKTMVGLGNVDNTSDLNKPVSTDTQTALNLKANKASPTFTGDVTSGGNIEAPAIKLTSGAADGYFLKTDADGNATWTPISASQVYKGTWNADTNTPTLADNTGVQGNFYRVTTPGTSDLGSGNKTFEINDDVSHNGTIWERIPAVGYTLQTATSTVLGGVKIGNGVSISNGVISVSTDYEPTKGLDDNYVTDAEAVVIGNTSGTNTGDEDTSSIQTKRPLKTIEGLPLEGNGDIGLTKAMVGLGSADNTSDADKPISSATQTALNNKVDKVTGSSLIQDTSITRLADTSGTNTGDQDLSPYSTATGVEDNADVTDTANVESAGALMDSEVTNLAQVKAFDASDYEPAKGADDNFVTDAEKTVIGNTSGTNTGDNATNSQYSGLVSDTGTPAILSNGSTPTLNSDITASEIRTLIGAGTSSTDTDTQLSTEQVQDIMGSTWIDGKNTIVVYDDVNGTLKIEAIDQRSDEEIRDVSSAQWIDGTNTTVVKDDAGNTIKINSVDTNTEYSTGSGLISSGTIFSHADTSSQSDSTNSGRTYIQSIDLDTYGHITSITTATETVTNDGGNAATLDSLDSNDFLRSNTSDNFSGSALTINDNSQFKIGGTSPFGNVGHLKYQATGTTLIADMGADIIYRDAGSSFLNRFIFSRGSGNFRAFGDVTAQNFIGNGSQITNVDASSLNGLSIAGTHENIPWPFIPNVGADGLMEIGRYIDFHLASNSGVDNNGRLALTSDKNLAWSGDFTAEKGNFNDKVLMLKGSGIKGNSSGINNSSFFAFYELDGTTRQGYIGFGSGSNADLNIRNDVSGNLLKLDGDGDLNYDGRAGFQGDVTASGFFESSDKRLKIDIKKISKSVYSYELKTQPGITVYGTIADEIIKTNPEVVKKPDDGGMMSVNYNSFLSLKLAEQENENKEQNNKIDSLQQQIDELKELIKNK